MPFGARINQRLSRLIGSRRPGARPSARERERDLTVRIEHLEAVVEGLQDALYRQAQQYHRDVAELRRRTDPAEIARALSEDARKRGL